MGTHLVFLRDTGRFHAAGIVRSNLVPSIVARTVELEPPYIALEHYLWEVGETFARSNTCVSAILARGHLQIARKVRRETPEEIKSVGTIHESYCLREG